METQGLYGIENQTEFPNWKLESFLHRESVNPKAWCREIDALAKRYGKIYLCVEDGFYRVRCASEKSIVGFFTIFSCPLSEYYLFRSFFHLYENLTRSPN